MCLYDDDDDDDDVDDDDDDDYDYDDDDDDDYDDDDYDDHPHQLILSMLSVSIQRNHFSQRALLFWLSMLFVLVEFNC